MSINAVVFAEVIIVQFNVSLFFVTDACMCGIFPYMKYYFR